MNPLLLVVALQFSLLVVISAPFRADAFTAPVIQQYAASKTSALPDATSNRKTAFTPRYLSSNSSEENDVTSIVKYYTDVNLDTDIIKANILDGELGERGEAFTAAALFLVFCVFLGGLPFSFFNNLFTFMGGPGLLLGGAGVALAGVNDLSSENLTPFSKPVSQGTLVKDGIYGKVRHPMYTGLIAFMTGFSIVTGSASRLAITAFLILVLDAKCNKEEEFLMEQYPDYAEYKSTVTGKFLPGDWFKFTK